MTYASLFSIVNRLYLCVITCSILGQAVNLSTANIELQPTSIIPANAAVATGTETILAVSVTTVYSPDLPSNATIQQYLAYDASLATSAWSISVTVYSTDTSIDSRLSVSWPAGQGPSSTLSSSQTHRDVCVVYFADLFSRFNISGIRGEASCFDIEGSKCIRYLITQVQSGDLLKVGCSGVVEVPIPESCSSIYTDKITVNLTTFTSSTLESSSPFIGITDLSDSTNHSAVLSNAMQRTWPIMIVEIGNNGPSPGPIFSPLGCVQAINSTTSNSTSRSTSSATSASAASGSSTVTSAARRCNEICIMNGSFGLLATLLASILIC